MSVKKLYTAASALLANKTRAAVFLLVAALAAVPVLAQVTVPLVTSARPFADLLQVIPSGQPSAQSVYTPWASVTNVYGYYKAGTATANQTLSMGANVTFAQFANASAMGNLYLYLPAAPFDGARACIFTIGGFTAMTMYAGTTSATLNNPVTSLAANTGTCYLYSASNTAWDRN